MSYKTLKERQRYWKKWILKHPEYQKEWRLKHPEYFRNWDRNKRCDGKKHFVFKRDSFKCQFCCLSLEKSINEYKKELAIHHKDGDKENNYLNNLITLCHFCHAKLHNKPQNIKEIIKLRKSGLTFQKIGELFGVSRQRIHQIINKHY